MIVRRGAGGLGRGWRVLMCVEWWARRAGVRGWVPGASGLRQREGSLLGGCAVCGASSEQGDTAAVRWTQR